MLWSDCMNYSLMNIAEQKTQLREVAKKQRTDAVLCADNDAGRRFTEHLIRISEALGVNDSSVIAGYWAMSNELNVTAAMTTLVDKYGVTCALPVVVAKDTPLIFRMWSPGLELESGGFGTHHPPENSPECTPNILLIPLLAFDLQGFRIGWGGGFYDRTLAKLGQKEGGVVAIGSAYAGQQMAEIVHDDLDLPMDWIVTEQFVHQVAKP